MKAKVVLKYRDKNTKVIHKAGEIIEVGEERFEEINKGKTRLEEVKEEEAESEEESEDEKDQEDVKGSEDGKNPEDEKDLEGQNYDEMSLDELKAIAKKLKIAGYTKMEKEALITAITDAEK